MAKAVCQGLRSWSDPVFLLTQDPIPFNLGLSSYSSSEGSRDFTGGLAGRTFLEAILTGDRLIDVDRRQPTQKHDVYGHSPIVSAPSPRLNQKSLELCTENLGNETGSDMSDSETVDSCAYSSSMPMREERLLKLSQGEARKAKKYSGFPPPLTTIKGEEPLRFKPRREQGRLVLEAVKTPPANRIFQAERNQGRLTLCFLDEPAPISDHNIEEEQDRKNGENKDEVEGGEDEVGVGDMRTTTETFKCPCRCNDSDHSRQQLQLVNRGLLNLGDVIMGGHFQNIRLIFWVALLSTIC